MCDRRSDRRGRGTAIPRAQRGDRPRQRRFQRMRRRHLVVGAEERRQELLKGGEVRVVGRRYQAVEGEVLASGQHADGVHPARVLGVVARRAPRVVGVVGPARAVGAGGRERPVIGVLDPADGRIEQRDRFRHRVQTFPLGRRVAAVDGFPPVEFRVAPRQEVAVEVCDGAVGVGVHGVVRRIGPQVHRAPEFGVGARLGPQPRLRERLDRILHQADRDPFSVLLPDHRSVVAVIDGERTPREPAALLERQLECGHAERPLAVAVAVGGAFARAHDGLGVFVDRVAAAGGVHPADAVIETLIHEELAPGDGAVGVQPFVAGDVHLGPEIEGRVRIDQQQRVAARAVLGCDREPVGAAGFRGEGARWRLRLDDSATAVEPLERL